MTGRSVPSILLLASAGAESGAVARILTEAGIAVTAVRDEATALHVAAAEAFDLAIVVAPLPAALAGARVVKRLRRAQPGLEIMYMGEVEVGRRAGDAAGFATRRMVGCVRERLAGSIDADAAQRSAEFVIAEARLGCLYQRAATAQGGAARDLAREIDTAIAQRETLRREAAGAAI